MKNICPRGAGRKAQPTVMRKLPLQVETRRGQLPGRVRHPLNCDADQQIYDILGWEIGHRGSTDMFNLRTRHLRGEAVRHPCSHG